MTIRRSGTPLVRKPTTAFSSKMRATAALAVLAGLALRLFFVLKFPARDSGDAPFYIELAWNWLKKGIYGFPIAGRLTPVDMRVPGYPAFLAAIFTFAGQSQRAVMLVQAVLDLATCFLTGADCRKARAGVIPPPGGACRIVARSTLSVYRQLYRGCLDRDTRHVSDRLGAARSARSRF